MFHLRSGFCLQMLSDVRCSFDVRMQLGVDAHKFRMRSKRAAQNSLLNVARRNSTGWPKWGTTINKPDSRYERGTIGGQVTGLADTKGPAGQCDANLMLFHHFLGHLAAVRWPRHFFPRACSGSLEPMAFTFAVQQIGPHTEIRIDALQPTVLVFEGLHLRDHPSPWSSNRWRTHGSTSMPPYLARHL